MDFSPGSSNIIDPPMGPQHNVSPVCGLFDFHQYVIVDVLVEDVKSLSNTPPKQRDWRRNFVKAVILFFQHVAKNIKTL